MLFFTCRHIEPLKIGEVRKVEISAPRTELIPITINRKLPDSPDRHRRRMQLRELPATQQPPGPTRLAKPRPLTPETPWTTRRSPLVNQLFRIWVTVIVE